MHIWTLENWKNSYDLQKASHRIGLRVRYESDVNDEVKRACKEFCKWLRKEYFFPIRVCIYIKSAEYITAMDGDKVSATCFLPYDKSVEPYIKVATGDYNNLLKKGPDNALASILHSIIHELTHYFQWVNDINLTNVGYERQAKAYTSYIIDEYAETREHP